ncbi:MAG: DUF3333 domain-containing protein [Gammaproteobacteria bacterium]|nr:DUF3333 domain-containing protein [Gammaproteobacteria bacterium]
MNNTTKTAEQTQALVRKSLARRYRAERRFRLYGMAAVAAGIGFVIFLFGTIFAQGASVFRQSYVQLTIVYDPETIDPAGTRIAEELVAADYQALVRAALRERFPNVEGRSNLRELYGIVSSAASIELQRRVVADPSMIGKQETLWLLADDTVDMLLKEKVRRSAPEEERRLSDQQIGFIDTLRANGTLKLRFNAAFLSNGDSRDPEQAGVRGANSSR